MSAIEQTKTPAVTPTVKFRESCDSCLVAKVKCSKTRPVCARCLANGATCGYSPSSRAGRKNRNAAPSDPSKASTRPPPTPSSSSLHAVHPMLDNADGSIRHSNNDIFHDLTTNFSHEDPSQGQSGMGNKAPTTQGEIEMTDFFSNSPFGDEFGDALLQFSPQAYLQNLNPTTPSPTNSTSQNTVSPAWTANETPYSFSPLSQLPVDLMSFDQASSSYSAPSPEILALQESPPRVFFPPGSETKFQCDCFALCLQALQTLHNHSQLPMSVQPGGLPFDVVLNINREAMRGCAKMLNCAKCVSKSGSSISTMLLATIFGKIISLYGSACFSRFGPSTVNQGAVKVAIGAYTLTGDDRRLLEMEIILLELGKVESILLAYQERFRDVHAEKDSCPGNALTSYLGKNLRCILDFLQARRGTGK